MFLTRLSKGRKSSLSLALAAILLTAASPARAAVWTPPVGIPAPSFGINEFAPATPNPWTVSTAGFYYVDATKAAATDTNNPYGTPAKPRRTIPTVLPAGAVIELHGPYDESHSSPLTLVAEGTAARPVFVRGVSALSRPLVRSGWEVKGTYLVIENIDFSPMPDNSSSGFVVIRLPASHVVLRHSNVQGTPDGGGVGIVNWEVAWGEVYTGTGVLDNIVVYDNTIHDNGDVNATYDQDVHGIGVSDHVNHLWVVDNQIYRNSGDGIQINAGAGQGASTHHLYLGRNVSHHNKQSGLWVKEATDVIVSQNEIYGHRPGNSSLGQCTGAQYAPDWVWFLFNHVHDCEYGVSQASDNQEASHTFIIGNLIHNIHRSTSTTDPTSGWAPSAVMMSGGDQRKVINNTIYDVDSGINIATPAGSLEVANNIIANVTIAQASHVLLGYSALAATSTLHHSLLFGDPRIDWGNGQFHLTASQLTQMQSLASDPQFVNAPAGDFHLRSTSPAVGKGDVNGVYAVFQQRYGISIATDIEGTPRPAAGSAIGAYEQVCTASAAIPGVPQGFTGSANSSTISLQWVATAMAGCLASPSYVLEIGTAPGTSNLANVPVGTVTTLSIPAVAVPAGTYYFRVRATNAAGTSAPSSEVALVFSGAPGVPGVLKSTLTTTRMTLTWAVPTTGGSATAYILEAGSASGLKDYGSVSLPTTATTLAVAAPPKGTYYLRVKAQNSSGTGPERTPRLPFARSWPAC